MVIFLCIYLKCGEAEGRHRAQMEEVSRHHSTVVQGMEEELVEARVQISALQEELKSLQASSCTEVHAMDCTSQGEEGEPAILQVDTCDGHTREDTEVGGRGTGGGQRAWHCSLLPLSFTLWG